MRRQAGSDSRLHTFGLVLETLGFIVNSKRPGCRLRHDVCTFAVGVFDLVAAIDTFNYHSCVGDKGAVGSVTFPEI